MLPKEKETDHRYKASMSLCPQQQFLTRNTLKIAVVQSRLDSNNDFESALVRKGKGKGKRKTSPTLRLCDPLSILRWLLSKYRFRIRLRIRKN